MKKIIKNLFLVSILFFFIGRAISNISPIIGTVMVSIAFLSNLILIVNLIKLTGWEHKKYFIALVIALIVDLGSLFKLMHWPGAIIIKLFGIIYSFITGRILLISYLKSQNKSLHIYKGLLGLVILIEFFLLLDFSTDLSNYNRLINYIIVAISGTIIINKSTENIGEKSLILLLLLQGSIGVISHFFQLLQN